ncbi:MAG: cell division protein ZipA [Candidatus Symbiodolus clandestinus]
MDGLLWRHWLRGSGWWFRQIFLLGLKKLQHFWQYGAAVLGSNRIHEDQNPQEVHRFQEPTLAPLRQEPERLSSAGIATALSQADEELKVFTIATNRGEEKRSEADSCTLAEDPLIILYVVAHQQDRLYGEPLLRSLLQLGFRYGEHSIFHRHLNPLGSGPILFSVVNMVNPGSFNPNTMHEFTTPGVAFYMTIPAYGDTVQNFKLMLQAAQRLADDISGVVLDDQRHLLTLEQSEAYKARIRQLLTQDAAAAPS